MTIPNLISHYQKESTATQLKETYSTIAQAVRMSEAENEEVAGWNFADVNGIVVFDKYLAPYLKCTKKMIGAGAIKYYKPNGQRETNLAIMSGGAGVYTLLSGVQIIVGNGVVTSDSAKNIAGRMLMIDLNGYDTKPNRIGRDTFFMYLTIANGFVMHYSNDREYGRIQRTRKQLKDGPSNENYQCNYMGRGIWCGALIQRDGWKISDDYPWK